MIIHNPAPGTDTGLSYEMTEEETFIIGVILRAGPADLRDLADNLDKLREEAARPSPMSAFMRKRADKLEAAGIEGAK